MGKPAGGAARRSGKKNRKWGRHTKRSNAHANYNAERRDITNKIRKLIQHCYKFTGDNNSTAVLNNLEHSNPLASVKARKGLTHHG